MQSLYLAGPIEDVSDEEAMRWRIWTEEYFCNSPIRAINPYWYTGESVRKKIFRDKDFSLVNRRDKYLMRRCDLLLVNLSIPKARVVGSLIEVGMFFERDLPIFVCIDLEDKNNYRNHPMLRDIVCVWESDLRKLCDIIKEFG